MFKVNGTGSHFWLIEGKLTPLLKWSASPCQKTPCQKTTMTFSGKTFKRPETGHQWFDEFVLSEGETPVVSVATDNGELQIKFKGKNVQHASDASSVRALRARPLTGTFVRFDPHVLRAAVQLERAAALAAPAGRT